MTIARVAPRGAAAPIPTAGLAGQPPCLSLKEGESGAAAFSITLGSQPAAGLVVTLAEQASAFAGNAMQAIASTSAVDAVAAAAGFTRITIPAAAWNVPVTVQLASPRDIIARTAAAGSSLPGRLQVRRRQRLQRGHKLECVPAAAQRARAGDRHGRRGPDAAHLGRHPAAVSVRLVSKPTGTVHLPVTYNAKALAVEGADVLDVSAAD